MLAMFAVILVSGSLLAYFGAQIKLNWPAWNAACASVHGIPLRTHILAQVKRPIFLHNFKNWTDPSMLGYPIISAAMGAFLLVVLSIKVGLAYLNSEALSLSSSSAVIIYPLIISCVLPVLALHVALRDRSSFFGQELGKQREIFGVFKSENQKVAEMEAQELDEAVDKPPAASERVSKRL